ncbi:MAG: DNA translocase FtsK [Elusimicrobia bacterium]|nr:DNA translocase FtsK [Elusimicrobiota bacterium]
MRPIFSSRFSYKARTKNKTRSSGKRVGWISAALAFISVLSFYCVLFPELSGLWGRKIAQFLGWLFGSGRFLFPPLVGYVAILRVFKKDGSWSPLKIFLSLGLLGTVLIFLSLVGQSVWNENYGGILGQLGGRFLSRLFGTVGAWIVNLGIFSTLVILFVGATPGEVFHHLAHTLVEDWKSWKKERGPKTKEKRPPVIPAIPSLSQPVQKKAPLKIVGMKEEKEDLPSPESPSLASSVAEPKIARKQEKEKSHSPSTPNGAVKSSELQAPSSANKIPYTSPDLSIFEEPRRNQPVAKEELTAKAKLLEQTLANFNIAATVVEIHPGPVITRYDLEPAPGVKISSISSRADDLALAMKAMGIRVLAPIPGKGAVGIEIPNSNPETVGIKEMLARPEFVNHPSPLAFVLGKTVSGEPYIVDLAAMPHILVAGATGSGKSVVVHAMISSILFRMPPERVKFVMIDPKRLELPSYSMIPHLYDPRVSPMQAEVITNSKQAAKALMRLVKVMEYRYDLFAKANVRNIDSYNKKRKAAGLPPEYFLVVIIDELADLMLTSPKEVEDSIQRLAQMARAVGIHLVLATQRPSVDVITGVIKANLPARIALRVASVIDSRVIVDTTGAESLLGKGDMLFLPPAQPEPIRVQGAYVSEKDVESLMEHVKQFGVPDYEDLFSSGSALEFAVEDKKEMKDLIDALTLVLERHRVSQDLLKAHFGSSARATNILSLMEVKEFIKKPEGTNRWEINFDLIEDFLGKVNLVPESEGMPE